MEYTVIVFKAEEGGYWAKVPALPGCYSQGETMDETMQNIKEAIESHMAALVGDGQKVLQEPPSVIGRVEVGVG